MGMSHAFLYRRPPRLQYPRAKTADTHAKSLSEKSHAELRRLVMHIQDASSGQKIQQLVLDHFFPWNGVEMLKEMGGSHTGHDGFFYELETRIDQARSHVHKTPYERVGEVYTWIKEQLAHFRAQQDPLPISSVLSPWMTSLLNRCTLDDLQAGHAVDSQLHVAAKKLDDYLVQKGEPFYWETLFGEDPAKGFAKVHLPELTNPAACAERQAIRQRASEYRRDCYAQIFSKAPGLNMYIRQQERDYWSGRWGVLTLAALESTPALFWEQKDMWCHVLLKSMQNSEKSVEIPERLQGQYALWRTRHMEMASFVWPSLIALSKLRFLKAPEPFCLSRSMQEVYAQRVDQLPLTPNDSNDLSRLKTLTSIYSNRRGFFTKLVHPDRSPTLPAQLPAQPEHPAVAALFDKPKFEEGDRYIGLEQYRMWSWLHWKPETTIMQVDNAKDLFHDPALSPE